MLGTRTLPIVGNDMAESSRHINHCVTFRRIFWQKLTHLKSESEVRGIEVVVNSSLTARCHCISHTFICYFRLSKAVPTDYLIINVKYLLLSFLTSDMVCARSARICMASFRVFS